VKPLARLIFCGYIDKLYELQFSRTGIVSFVHPEDETFVAESFDANFGLIWK